MGLADKCHLHIPFKRWAYRNPPAPSEEENNWLTLERWADNLLKNCMGSGATLYGGELKADGGEVNWTTEADAIEFTTTHPYSRVQFVGKVRGEAAVGEASLAYYTASLYLTNGGTVWNMTASFSSSEWGNAEVSAEWGDTISPVTVEDLPPGSWTAWLAGYRSGPGLFISDVTLSVLVCQPSDGTIWSGVSGA